MKVRLLAEGGAREYGGATARSPSKTQQNAWGWSSTPADPP